MMKRFGIVLVGALAALSLSNAAYAEAAKAKAPDKASGGNAAAGKAVVWAADELKWIDPPNSPPGVKMAVLWGDPDKGPHGAIHKLPAGFVAPLHHHTADHHAFVAAGTVLLTPEGGAEKKLGPGSYFSFTGKKKHTTKCDAGAECQILVDCKGAWDLVPADAKKAEPKK